MNNFFLSQLKIIINYWGNCLGIRILATQESGAALGAFFVLARRLFWFGLRFFVVVVWVLVLVWFGSFETESTM